MTYNPSLRWFGLFRFRSPLLAESFPFLRVLRCFSSPGSLPLSMCSIRVAWACPHAGFPIRISSALTVAHTSPKLFAVYHVLRRHTMPRHPPYALTHFLHPHSFQIVDPEKLSVSVFVTRLFSSFAIHLLMCDFINSRQWRLLGCLLALDRPPIATSLPRLLPIRWLSMLLADTFPSLETRGLEPLTSALQRRRSPS